MSDPYDERLHWLLVNANPLERQKREMQDLLNEAIKERD